MTVFGKIIKRLFDIVFSLLFLICLSPIYLLTALGVVISSPGNPIYSAKRMGRGGKVFTCYKFRSMHKNSGKVHITTLRNDARIFPFGKFIRKTKIDELPQVINILLGQMSVVGPRPEDKEIADRIYKDAYSNIMQVKPGLTSIGSLYDFTHGELFADEAEYERVFLKQKLALELYYVENRSLWLDIKLIFRTAELILLTVFGKKNFAPPHELEFILSVGAEGKISVSAVANSNE